VFNINKTLATLEWVFSMIFCMVLVAGGYSMAKMELPPSGVTAAICAMSVVATLLWWGWPASEHKDQAKTNEG
jgi:branched-subunit amino acid transport protein AzlD